MNSDNYECLNSLDIPRRSTELCSTEVHVHIQSPICVIFASRLHQFTIKSSLLPVPSGTKWISVVITFQIHITKAPSHDSHVYSDNTTPMCLVQISTRRPATITEAFHGFLHSFQVNAGTPLPNTLCLPPSNSLPIPHSRSSTDLI